MKKTILLLVTIGTLNGCTSIFNPIGEDNFDCNRKSGVNPDWCHSVKSAIKSTDGHIPDTDFDRTFNMEEFYRQQGYMKSGDKKSDSSSSEKIQTTLPHQVARSLPVIDGPVREAPVVMQIYIKPFVNDDDVLVQGQTVFKEVVPSKWRGFAAIRKDRDSGAYPHYAENTVTRTSSPQPNPAKPFAGSTEFVQPGSASLNQSAKPSAAIDGNDMPQ